MQSKNTIKPSLYWVARACLQMNMHAATYEPLQCIRDPMLQTFRRVADILETESMRLAGKRWSGL